MKVLSEAPEINPVTIEEIKDQLRMGQDFYLEDAYLDTLIALAVNYVEEFCGISLITQTWVVYFDLWCELINSDLPRGNLQSVTNIVYLDEAGVSHTVDDDYYIVEGVGTNEGKIVFPSDTEFDFPSDLYESKPIRVTIVNGFGDSADDVPAMIKHAIKLHVAHCWTNREPLSGMEETAIHNLLYRYRIDNLL